MNGNDLMNLVSSILRSAKSNRAFFLCLSGIEGRFSLGEKGKTGYLLCDALPEQILAFVRQECGE